MENATKALLMAGAILIGIIIITLAVSMFGKTGNASQTYSKTVDQEQVSIFNTNFTKYIGKTFTIHVAKTIANFAESNNVDVNFTDNFKDKISDNTIGNEQYQIRIDDYDDNGYISKITIY